MKRVVACLALAAFGPACVSAYKTADPPPPPARVPVPALEELSLAPAPAGSTHVVLDAEKPSQIIEMVRAGELGEHGQLTQGIRSETRVVCDRTPCMTNLSVGPHDLRFLAAKEGSFQPGARVDAMVGPQPTEFRVTLSKREVERTSGYDVGRVLSIAGFLVAAAGFITWGTDQSLDQNGDSPLAVPSAIVGGVGLATLLVGTIMELSGRGVYRPGTYGQWNLSSGH